MLCGARSGPCINLNLGGGVVVEFCSAGTSGHTWGAAAPVLWGAGIPGAQNVHGRWWRAERHREKQGRVGMGFPGGSPEFPRWTDWSPCHPGGLGQSASFYDTPLQLPPRGPCCGLLFPASCKAGLGSVSLTSRCCFKETRD